MSTLSSKVVEIGSAIQKLHESIVVKYAIHEETGDAPISPSEDISIRDDACFKLVGLQKLISDLAVFGLSNSFFKNMNSELALLEMIIDKSIDKMISRPRSRENDVRDKATVRESCWTMLHDLSMIDEIAKTAKDVLNEMKAPLE